MMKTVPKKFGVFFADNNFLSFSEDLKMAAFECTSPNSEVTV